jgi:hypothetical protein
VSATIFFEGGGDKEATQSRCREGLSKYCAKLRPGASRLGIVAGGSREQTFDKFRTAALDSRGGEVVALLVDSEGPVAGKTAAEHLRTRDGWDFTGFQTHRVFLMVQTMEAWFLADRDTLAAFYDGGFLSRSLPGSATSIETIRKEDIEPALKKATKKTNTKGEYQKINHGAVLLALIDPAKVERASPHAASFHQFLRGL